MKINIAENADRLGKLAAAEAAAELQQVIKQQGSARLLLSTGASQFETLQHLVMEDVDWSKVEMFHLDEYVGLPKHHPASFRKYLQERFVDKAKGLKAAYFVDGEGDVKAMIAKLTAAIRKAPIDVALIGIGENAHIAFNDPPADFSTKDAYIVVNLDPRCRQQQVGEGWFATVDDVPTQAVSMTVYQIMQSKRIISCVPYKVKAEAVKLTMANDVTNKIPATVLKTHPHWTLYLDDESASLLEPVAPKG